MKIGFDSIRNLYSVETELLSFELVINNCFMCAN